MADKAKVLVVEDEEILLTALREELATGGYDVEGAGDGQDGMEMLQRLKGNPATKDVPVVILTNLSDYERISEALSLGAMDYLVKANYKLEDLLDKVKTVVARKNSQT